MARRADGQSCCGSGSMSLPNGYRSNSSTATGSPEHIATVEESYTGQFLKKVLNV